jgi:hypothetical protein
MKILIRVQAAACTLLANVALANPCEQNFDQGLSFFQTWLTEFYNKSLNHYFLTANPDEAKWLRASPELGWTPTCEYFAVFGANGNTPANYTRQIWRFYGSPTLGPNSHFFTANDAERQFLLELSTRTPASIPKWNSEGILLPIPGDISVSECNSGIKDGVKLRQIHRFYNNGHSRGVDPNHRYVWSEKVRAEMRALGWIDEGIAWCTS